MVAPSASFLTRVKRWFVAGADPADGPEEWAAGPAFTRGFLVGVPISALLWWGLIVLAKAVG